MTWRAAEVSPLQRNVGSASCGGGLGCCGSAADAPASGAGWLVSVKAAGAPSGMVADGGAEGSVAAWGAALSVGAPAAGLVTLESLCSGALRRFMMVVTRTAFCRRRENKVNLDVYQGLPELYYTSMAQELYHCWFVKKSFLKDRTYLPFRPGKVLLYLRTHVFLDVLIRSCTARDPVVQNSTNTTSKRSLMPQQTLHATGYCTQ